MIRLEIVAIPQWQPTATFYRPSHPLVVRQSIGLDQSHTVDELSAVLGYDIEQAIEDMLIGTERLDFQFEGRIHILTTAAIREQTSPNHSKNVRVAVRSACANTEERIIPPWLAQ